MADGLEDLAQVNLHQQAFRFNRKPPTCMRLAKKFAWKIMSNAVPILKTKVGYLPAYFTWARLIRLLFGLFLLNL
jgi:hypothetical protein